MFGKAKCKLCDKEVRFVIRHLKKEHLPEFQKLTNLNMSKIMLVFFNTPSYNACVSIYQSSMITQNLFRNLTISSESLNVFQCEKFFYYDYLKHLSLLHDIIYFGK